LKHGKNGEVGRWAAGGNTRERSDLEDQLMEKKTHIAIFIYPVARSSGRSTKVRGDS
jgi:hypothetical protein